MWREIGAAAWRREAEGRVTGTGGQLDAVVGGDGRGWQAAGAAGGGHGRRHPLGRERPIARGALEPRAGGDGNLLLICI